MNRSFFVVTLLLGCTAVLSAQVNTSTIAGIVTPLTPPSSRAFASPAPLTFGTSGRDLISAPGFWNWDLSLFKNFHFSERKVLQFRAEFFDAFNQVRFDPPVLDTSSVFFGQIQSAEAPRILQMGLRFQF